MSHSITRIIAVCIGLCAGLCAYTTMPQWAFQPEAEIWFSEAERLNADTNIAQSASFATFIAENTTLSDEQVLDRLSVRNRYDSHILVFRLSSRDAVNGSRILHDIAQLFIEYRAHLNTHLLQQTSDIIARQLTILREDMVHTKIALQGFQARYADEFSSPTSPSTISSPIDNPLADYDSALTALEKAKLSALMAQQRLASATILFEKFGHLDALASDYIPPIYRDIRTELRMAEELLTRIRLRYGPRHPERIAQEKHVATITQKSKALARDILALLQTQADTLTLETDIPLSKAAQDRINGVAPLTNTSTSRDDLLSRLQTLQQEALSAQTIYTEFKEQADLSAGAQSKWPAGLITTAAIDTEALSSAYAFWLQWRIALCTGLSGIIAALLSYIILINLRRRLLVPVHTEKDIVKASSNISLYGQIPLWNITTLPHHEAMQNKDYGLWAEAYRSLRTQLRLRHKGLETLKVISVTSALPGEGKSTFATGLAAVAAQSGDRVLVIDADMRRPILHSIYDIKNSRGLVDVLTERYSFEEAVYKKHSSGVHILSTKAVPAHALTLLDSTQMWQMIKSLRSCYDLVLVDTPSCLYFSDAHVIADLCDLNLHLIPHDRTPIKTLKQSLQSFTNVTNAPLGCIFTHVRKNAYQHMTGTARTHKPYSYRIF